jgi:hypothetical protein
MSDKISLRLKDTQPLIESFRYTNGLNTSKAIRFIIEDYFRIREATEANKTINKPDYKKLIEDLSQIKKDMDEVKSNTNTILNMLLVIGFNDENLKDEFVKYFPEYFTFPDTTDAD